jgi:predicted Na+-dependent transporter
MSAVCTLTIASFRFCQIETLENFQVHIQIGVACVGFEVGCSANRSSQWAFYRNLTQDA